MADSNLEKAFDSDMSGEKRNLRVYLINPPPRKISGVPGATIVKSKRKLAIVTRCFKNSTK